MGKNYIDHDTKVKIIDGILENNESWQWLVNEIEKEFDLTDVTTWQGFLSLNNRLDNVFHFLIKILSQKEYEWDTSSAVLSDVIMIMKYYIGLLSQQDCRASLNTEYGKTLYLVVFVTKHENADNNLSYLYDYSLFTLKNYWQLLSFDSILDSIDEIDGLIKTITIDGWERQAKILRDNLNKVEYECQADFFKKYGDALLNVNAFSFQLLEGDLLTWQEHYLLNMVRVCIDINDIHPQYINNNIQIPDHNNWTVDVIDRMMNFFNNHIASFVLESIKYIRYRITPTENVKIEHCKLLLSSMDKGEDILHTSSLAIISQLFFDKTMNDIGKNPIYKKMMIAIHNYTSPHTIMALQERGIPLSKSQRRIHKEYVMNYYNHTDAIVKSYEFLEMIKHHYGIQYITNEQFAMIQNSFLEIIKNNDAIIPSLFYEYMCFLFDLNSKGININKNNVQLAIINIQNIWEKNIYNKQLQGMQEFKQELSIPTTQIDTFNKEIITKPYGFAEVCMLTDPKMFCRIMEYISKNPIIYMVSRMKLSPTFPEKDIVNLDRHDIDQLLVEYIDKMKEEKGYRFLNVLDTEVYIVGIHERYQDNTRMAVSMINNEKVLYEKVANLCDYDLIDYDGNIKLAHVVQLFPYIEMQLRTFSKQIGFVPFKEQDNNFMNYKDPSSLLREIITYAYKKTDSFENISDFLFVYHCLYNSNSLNIRNDCIHARQYLKGDQLRFAFRITLLSILMLNKRIEIISHSV